MADGMTSCFPTFRISAFESQRSIGEIGSEIFRECFPLWDYRRFILILGSIFGSSLKSTLSPSLRLYHKLLWSKALPSGRLFDLDDTVRGVYLHHSSELGEFFLCSDSVIPTFTRWLSLRRITELFTEEENEAFRTIGYTIGGMMVFPGNRIDGKPTINGTRGLNRKIADRFDLTLECIRRHYLVQSSPLGETLARYRDFFALFEDFSGYVEFFML